MSSRRRHDDDDDYSDEGSSRYDDDGGSYSDEQPEGSYSDEGSYDSRSGSYYSDERKEEESHSKEPRDDDGSSQTPSAQSEYDDGDVSHSRESFQGDDDDDESAPPAFDTSPDFTATGFDDGFAASDGFGSNGKDSGGDAFGFSKDSGFDSANFDDGFGFGDGAKGFGGSDDPFAFGDGKDGGGFGFNSTSDQPSTTKDVFADDGFGDDNLFSNNTKEDPADGSYSGGEDEDYSERDQSSYTGRDQSGRDEDDGADQSYSDRDHSHSEQSHSYSDRDQSYSNRDQSYSGRDRSDHPGDNSDRGDHSASNGGRSGGDGDADQAENDESEDDISGGEQSYSGSDSSGRDKDDFSGNDVSGDDHSYSDRGPSARDEDDYSGTEEDGPDSSRFATKNSTQSQSEHSENPNPASPDPSAHDLSNRDDDYSQSYYSGKEEDDSGKDESISGRDDGRDFSGHKEDFSGREDSGHSDREEDFSGHDLSQRSEDHSRHENSYSGHQDDNSDNPEFGDEDVSASAEGGGYSERRYNRNDGSAKADNGANTDDFSGSYDDDVSQHDQNGVENDSDEGFKDGNDVGFDDNQSNTGNSSGSQAVDDDLFGNAADFVFDSNAPMPSDVSRGSQGNEDAAGTDRFSGFEDNDDFGFDNKGSADGFTGDFGDAGDFGFENNAWAADGKADGSERPEGFDDVGFENNQFGATDGSIRNASAQDDFSGSGSEGNYDDDSRHYEDGSVEGGSEGASVDVKEEVDSASSSKKFSRIKQRQPNPYGGGGDGDSYHSDNGRADTADEDESIDNSAYQTTLDYNEGQFDGADTLADTLEENTGHTMRLGFENSQENLEFTEDQMFVSERAGEVKDAKDQISASAEEASGNGDIPPEEPTLKEKLESRPGRITDYKRYSREQMMKLTAQNDDGKKKKSKQKKKAAELIDVVTNVNEVMIYFDELVESGETEPDSDAHLLLGGFECLVGIYLQLSDELDVMSTFAKSSDKAATEALNSLLKFALPVNEVFAQLRPVIEHYFTNETDEEMTDLLYGMNLMVDLLCDLSHKVGEKQEWNERAGTAYATLVELLARDTLEVVSIYDDVDTPEYELSVEIEDAWNGTGHIEEFQTLEEAPDLAIFRQICYEVMLSTDKWCPDTETLMNICGIEDVMLDEASEFDEVDENELALTPESAIQVLDKVNGEPLRRPALLASVLRRVLPGQKISDKSLAEHLTSIRSAMRSPLGLPASNLIGISSIPEVASDPNALGVAGVGKTTLAALVADHRDVRRHFVDGIAWVHLGQKELNYTRYIQCLRDLISQLEVSEEEEPAFPELLRTPGETGSQRRRREEGFLVFVRETMIAFLKKRAVLVVLDDVCFESDLDWFDFGAPSDNPDDEVSSCVTLVTTRRRNLLPAADMVEVDMMEEHEAAALLVRESGELTRSLSADSMETRSVVRECANHPLAVKSVGRWLNLKHATSGEEGNAEQLHKDVVESMERILKNGADDDADMMYEILNMSLSPSINGEPTSIIKFCFAAYVHVFCDKEYISEFALADATPIVPLGTVELLFEALLGLEEETLMKEGSLFYAQKKDAASLIPTALSSLGVFKIITTIAGGEEEEEEKAPDAKEEKYLQIMHVVQQEYGEYLLDQDISLRDLSVDAEKRWNKAIAKAYLATKPEWDSDTPDASLDYFLEMMPVHLIRGEMFKDAAGLLCNPSFVKGRLFALGRENGTRRHIKDCETLYDLLMKKKASARKKYEPKATMRRAYETLGDHLNMDEDEYIKEEGSPEAVEVGRCQFEIGFSLAEKRCWEAAIEHWEASQEILVSALGMVEVVAGILYNIGVVYTEMNEYEQALGSLKQCLRVRGTIHGEDHILYAQTIQRIGDVFLSMSDYHEAMESYNWALDVMHIEPSHHRIDIGDILENMGRIHFFKGESDDALQCFQDALQSKQTELGEDHPELSSIYEHIGNCLSEQGKVEDAIAHLEEAIRLKELDQFGGDETDAAVMTLQGVLSVRQGKQKAGLECYEKALQILVTKAPHRKEKIASLLHLIASVYLVSGENKKAMKLFEESLQARRKVLGFVHLDVASTLFSMAYLHQKRKRLDKALKCLEEALKIRQLRLPDSEKVAVTHEKIGTIARSIGKLKKAENAFSEALRIRKLIHGDNHPAVAKVMQDLGDLMDDLGEYEEAMKNYREAYRIRKSFGGDTLPVAETLYTIGFTYSNSGHYEKALECLDAALKIQRLHNGNDSPDCGDTLNMIGFLKAKCGQIDEAQECLRDALRIRKLQGDAIKISETLKNIGNAHRSKQEYRSAMETYQECLRIRQKELGREHDKVADALVAIGNIFADLSRPKEAMDAYQEALGIRARLFGDLDASLAPILQAMGMLDFYGNNYDRSLQLLNDYISIRKGNKNPRDGDYVNVLFTIGNIHQLRQDEQQAKKAWTEAYESFKDLGLAESNPEHAEQMEKLMRDHGLGEVVQSSSQDEFPEEPVRQRKGKGMLKMLKQKVKRGDGQNGIRRRKEKGQKL